MIAQTTSDAQVITTDPTLQVQAGFSVHKTNIKTQHLLQTDTKMTALPHFSLLDLSL